MSLRKRKKGQAMIYKTLQETKNSAMIITHNLAI